MNKPDNTKNSHTWLNYLPNGEIDKELFRNKVYDEIIELAELLKDNLYEDL